MTDYAAPLRRRLWPVFVLAAMLGLILACNGDDPPVGPSPAKDYPVYFIDGVDHTILYSYYPASNRLDSILLPCWVRWGYELSPDGDMLYACGIDSVYIISLVDTPHVVDFIEGRYRGGVALSDDGQLMALSGFDLEIRRTSDHSLVFGDTDQTFGGIFSHDGETFYAVGWVEGGGPQQLDYVLDVDLPIVSLPRRWQLPYRSVRKLVPFTNNQRLMLYTQFGTFDFSFDIYDKQRDSILFSDTLVPGSGTITLDPNGQYAYYTNPGTLMDGPPPPSEFYRFNLTDLRRDQVINTAGAFDDAHFNWWPVSQVAITPDRNWLVAIHSGGFDELAVYDLRRSRFSHFYRLDRGVLLQQLQCQRNP